LFPRISEYFCIFSLGEKIQEIENQGKEDKRAALKMRYIYDADYLTVYLIDLHFLVRHSSCILLNRAMDLSCLLLDLKYRFMCYN